MFCTKCGTQNKDDMNFCIKCGTKSFSSTSLVQDPIISKDTLSQPAKISFKRWLIGGICIIVAVGGGFASGNAGGGVVWLIIGVIIICYPLMRRKKS